MEPNLVLSQLGFKFFVTMIKTKGFFNSKNWSQDHTKVPLKTKKEVRTKIKGSF